MSATPRVCIAILLFGLGTAIAFSGAFARADLVLPADALLLRSADGISINLLTGAYVPR